MGGETPRVGQSCGAVVAAALCYTELRVNGQERSPHSPQDVVLQESEGSSSAMKFYSFQIIIEKELEDEGYFAYTPTVPGCFSNGRTIEEAKRNIRQAIEQHLASMLEHSQLVPQNDRLVHVEELTVAIPE
jgi:predicted RNase H-like HicB family nuclease